MNKLTKILLLILLLYALRYPLSASYAAVPHLINYQGRLTDSSGKPIPDGTHTIVLRLYNAQAAGVLRWQGTYQVSVQKGLFSVLLGGVSDSGFNFATLNFDEPYYLEILVNGEVMSPRQMIASAGYAIRAEKAEEAQNANKVANVEVSVTPSPNKLLPLDNNAKLPVSALKVYDSGWFAAAAGTAYAKTHNLGTTKILATIYASVNSDGSGNTTIVGSWWWDPNSTNYNTTMTALSTTQITVKTQARGIGQSYDGGIVSGYLRIVMLALE